MGPSSTAQVSSRLPQCHHRLSHLRDPWQTRRRRLWSSVLAYDVDSAATTASDAAQDDDDDSDDEDEDEDSRRKVAIKAETPSNRWEYHILSQLQARLPASLLPSFISARKLYCYADASFLLLELGEKGTLLDVVNHASTAGVAPPNADAGGAGVEEVLAMFFVTELLRAILSLHRIGVIHGDLKIDNCLLRLSDVKPASSWSNIYSVTAHRMVFERSFPYRLWTSHRHYRLPCRANLHC